MTCRTCRQEGHKTPGPWCSLRKVISLFEEAKDTPMGPPCWVINGPEYLTPLEMQELKDLLRTLESGPGMEEKKPRCFLKHYGVHIVGCNLCGKDICDNCNTGPRCQACRDKTGGKSYGY